MGSVQVKLEQVISGLKQSFHSIDIRAAVKKSDPGWQSVLTAIRISARPLEEVRQRYADLEKKFGKREIELFRILLQVSPFTELDRILRELAQSRVTVEGEQISLSGKLSFDMFEGLIERHHGLIRPWDEDCPSIYCHTGEMSKVYHQREVTAGIRSSLGLSSVGELVDAFLEVKGSSTHNLDLFIYVEMPARIKSVRAIGQTVEVEVQAERNLRNLHLVVSRYDSTGVTILEKKKLELEQAVQIGEDMVFTLFRVKSRLDLVSEDDIISCALTHSSVPELDEVRVRRKKVTPAEEKNPLLECLKQFWDMEKLYQQLERPYETLPHRVDVQPQDAFQKSVARLLNLAGFQAIDLERDDKIYHPESKVERATIDILAYHRKEKILLLGACTINVPKAEDYEKLLHTTAILKKLFSGESPVQLVPVLFSSQENESPFKGDRSAQGLRILNAHRISVLRKLVEKGEEEQFVQFLQGFPPGTELREMSEWEL